MSNMTTHKAESDSLHHGEDVSWVIFSVGDIWVAVVMDKVEAIFETADVQLDRGPVTGSWIQHGREGTVWLPDSELRPVEGEPNSHILWLAAAGGDIGILCHRAEEVPAGPLVSVHGLPPVLADSEGLLIGLLLPDKRRVIGVIDIDVLQRQLSGTETRDDAGQQGEEDGRAG